jgi:hypothetical protein
MIVRHPYRALLTIVGAMVVFFLLSASGQPDTFWSAGPSWLGALGWGGFVVSTIVFLGLGAFLAVRRLSGGGQTHRA